MTQTQQAPFAATTVQPPKSPEQVREPGEGTVMMVFPRPVRLTTKDGPVDFKAGINEVPEHLADEPWLKHNGVKRQGAKGSEPAPGSWEAAAADLPRTVEASMTEHHVAFLRHRGYQVENVEAAQKFYERLNVDQRESFMTAATEWEGDGTSQGEMQRRVQDRASGATKPAPPNNKGADGGPKPATVNDLVNEGKVPSRSQAGASTGEQKPPAGAAGGGSAKPVGTATTQDQGKK